jgi:hypothetical protein
MPNPSTVPARQLAAIVAQRVQLMTDDLNAARRALAQLPRDIAPAVIALETRNNGWPARRGEGGGSTGISDPVGAAVVGLDRWLELNDQIKMLWATSMTGVVTVANMLHQMAEMAPQLAPEATKASLCSIALGMPGIENWGSWDGHALKDCNDLVHADGLCARHYTARRRWLDAEKAGRSYVARGARAS